MHLVTSFPICEHLNFGGTWGEGTGGIPTESIIGEYFQARCPHETGRAGGVAAVVGGAKLGPFGVHTRLLQSRL